ncbi:tRNA lysidine(34) synthetase TilS, partial [bacterium]|nr:tRNA lysidine(34) synthetase TilS [bacterium]
MRVEDIDISEFFAGGKLGVAVSGGRDSMAMLHFICSQKERYDYKIVVINIEHGIRGEESVSDSLFVKDYCNNNGIVYIGSTVDAPDYAEKRGLSYEQAARELRYKIFDKLLAKGEVNKIALAHHLDDQCETMLMRILRGTGINGLAGIQAVRNNYIRPFLKITREEIDRYVKENNIPFREDSTNDCIDYSRNYLRQEIFPRIRERYPSYQNAFSRLARFAVEQVELLDKLCPIPDYINGEASLAVKDLADAPIALVKRSMYLCMKSLSAEVDFEEVNINDVLKLTAKDNGSAVNLAGGVTAHKEYNRIVFAKS